MVRRGRNHPSIILWSLGNEEMNVQHTEPGIRLLRKMQDLVHKLDPSRCLLGTETGGSASTRGLYEEEQSGIHLELSVYEKRIVVWSNPKRKGIVSAYGETFTTWGKR